MQIYTENKKVETLLNKPEIQELLNYFQQLETPVILRNIRKSFQNQEHLDKNLELLIDQGIISREDRRYQLRVALLKHYPASNEVTEFRKQVLEKYSAKQLLAWLGEVAWIEELKSTTGIDFPLAERHRLRHEAFDLVTLNCGGEFPETLPNYFEKVDQPERFPRLASLLGDVNPDFFTSQIALIFEKVSLGRSPRRESIFLESLLSSRLITSQPDWRFLIPVYEEGDLPDLTLEIDDETRFFFVRQLAEELLDKEKSFTYLIKKKA